jgi:hypothetical protein
MAITYQLIHCIHYHAPSSRGPSPSQVPSLHLHIYLVMYLHIITACSNYEIYSRAALPLLSKKNEVIMGSKHQKLRRHFRLSLKPPLSQLLLFSLLLSPLFFSPLKFLSPLSFSHCRPSLAVKFLLLSGFFGCRVFVVAVIVGSL